MIKSKYNGITLDCMMQTEEITTLIHPEGVLSKDNDGNFLFQESIKKPRTPPNPQLFTGKFLSLTRNRKGKYQINLKLLDADSFDRENYAYGVYSEVTSAIERIL